MVDPEKNFPWSQIIICAVVIELGIQKVNLHFQRASISLKKKRIILIEAIRIFNYVFLFCYGFFMSRI